MKNDHEVRYAGLFSRFLAFIVDFLIISFLVITVSEWLELETLASKIFAFTVWWIYVTVSISKYNATLGNMLVGLKVLQMDMKPLSFWKITLRYLLFILYFISVLVLMASAETVSDEYSNWSVLALPILLSVQSMVFFTAHKQTFYDYLVKSVVVDSVKGENPLSGATQSRDKRQQAEALSAVRQIIRIVAGVVIAVGLAIFVVYMSVMYMAFGGKSSSDEPVKALAKTKDYNNTKIDYYKDELEKATAEFIEADTKYEILHGDVKKDLALNCIRFFIKKEGSDDWLDEGTAYRINARNHYATTVELVKKAKKNERYMGHHFYDYDLNEVHEIEEDIADMWDINANKDTCEKKMSVETMYKIFILKYIQNREESKARYLRDLEWEQKRKQKRFYKEQIAGVTAWLEILYKQHPEYGDYMKRVQKNIEEKKRKSVAINRERDGKDLLKSAKTGRSYASLRLLEVKQILRGKAEVIRSSYDDATDRLNVVIKGAECREFTFPKNTKCHPKQDFYLNFNE